MLQLAKKYLPVDDSQPILNKEQSIDGLFSIGSIGSIAQAYGSDIDCWVCLEEEKLGPENIKLLNAKLQAIELFSDKKFMPRCTSLLSIFQASARTGMAEATRRVPAPRRERS